MELASIKLRLNWLQFCSGFLQANDRTSIIIIIELMTDEFRFPGDYLFQSLNKSLIFAVGYSNYKSHTVLTQWTSKCTMHAHNGIIWFTLAT